MRTSEHAIRCTECPSAIVLRFTFPTWIDQAVRYVERIAEVEKWDVENRKCPIHRSKG